MSEYAIRFTSNGPPAIVASTLAGALAGLANLIAKRDGQPLVSGAVMLPPIQDDFAGYAEIYYTSGYRPTPLVVYRDLGVILAGDPEPSPLRPLAADLVREMGSLTFSQFSRVGAGERIFTAWAKVRACLEETDK